MMTCEEILKALRDGKAVKRKNEGYYFLLADDAIVEYSINNSKWVASNQSFYFRLDEVKKDKLDFEIYEPVLTEEERKYIAAIIAPLRKSWKRITITKIYGVGVCKERILFEFKNGDDEENYSLPSFDKGTMYNGMSLGTEYSLEELGL